MGAQFKVDTTEKIRTSIGVAKYNEYAKAMEDKHGKDKAAEIIAEPSNQLKDIEAYQVLYRLANNEHPKGGPPKTNKEIFNWSHADQVRLEMGEGEWWDSVKILLEKLFHHLGRIPLLILLRLFMIFTQQKKILKRRYKFPRKRGAGIKKRPSVSSLQFSKHSVSFN